MKETDLYLPVKALFERQGFSIKGEIGPIDVFGMKEQTKVAVELKLTINLKLIYQAVDRQRIADLVYIAVPEAALKANRDLHRYFLTLLRRLEIGLLSVVDDRAIVVLEAVPYDRNLAKKRSEKRQARLVKEFLGRPDDQQLGGSQGKRITAYRLRAMKIKDAMNDDTAYAPKAIKAITGVEDAYAILKNNYYGWFKKVDRGQYALANRKSRLK